MRRKLVRWFSVTIMLMLLSCDQQSLQFLSLSNPAPATNSKTESDVAMLQARVTGLEATINALNDEKAQLAQRLDVLELAAVNYQVAYLDPAVEGFARVETSVAPFVVSFSDVKPFADGVKVTLKIGTLAYAAFSEVAVKVRWGSRRPDKLEDFLAWNSSLQTQEVVLNKRLVPGTWNPVTLKLPKTKMEDLGHLEVALKASKIVLTDAS